ncbi:MAG: 50S ribosomal protein L18 [bacterium]|nr:50S ribosomal protein L18 [bacterium]
MNLINRTKRHKKIRSRMIGTAARPRACVFRSARGMEVQIIDDAKGVTLVSSHMIAKDSLNKTQLAEDMGKALADAAKKKGITNIVFDRGGYMYHGRVKALAEAMRAGGLQF